MPVIDTNNHEIHVQIINSTVSNNACNNQDVNLTQHLMFKYDSITLSNLIFSNNLLCKGVVFTNILSTNSL